MTIMQKLPALPEPQHRGLDGMGSQFDSFTADQMHDYARAAVAAMQTELNVAQAIIADRDAAEEERIFAQPLRTVDSNEPIGKLLRIEDKEHRTMRIGIEWADGAFTLPAGEYALYTALPIAQSQQEPAAWQERQSMSGISWSHWYDRAVRMPGQPLTETCGQITYEFRPLYTSPSPAAQPAGEHAIRESAHQGGVDAMTNQLRAILDGGICLASNPPELAELAARLAVQPTEVPEGCTPADAKVLREGNHALAAENQELRKALHFYAAQCHFAIGDKDVWDTVSGEPQNYWCDEAGTATIEDGSIAAMALRGHWINWEGDEPPLCKGEPEHALLSTLLAAQPTSLPEDVRRDAERMDWLAMRVVTVRTPLLYGSRAAFIAGPDHDDPSDAPSPSDLRTQIDAAMLAGKEKS